MGISVGMAEDRVMEVIFKGETQFSSTELIVELYRKLLDFYSNQENQTSFSTLEDEQHYTKSIPDFYLEQTESHKLSLSQHSSKRNLCNYIFIRKSSVVPEA